MPENDGKQLKKPMEEEADYEALFMRDAIQRAHDAELSALASLALIRSETDGRSQLLADMEREYALSPRVVDRHLRDEAERKSGTEQQS